MLLDLTSEHALRSVSQNSVVLHYYNQIVIGADHFTMHLYGISSNFLHTGSHFPLLVNMYMCNRSS